MKKKPKETTDVGRTRTTKRAFFLPSLLTKLDFALAKSTLPLLSMTSERISDLDNNHYGLYDVDNRPMTDSSLCYLCPCDWDQVHQALGECWHVTRVRREPQRYNEQKTTPPQKKNKKRNTRTTQRANPSVSPALMDTKCAPSVPFRSALWVKGCRAQQIGSSRTKLWCAPKST